jgi:NADH:ubiquinone oxidoreductase subunit 4 (subunit M)
VKAPHQPFADLNPRELAILVALAIPIFALGLFPAEPMSKTEAAAAHYQKMVTTTIPPSLGRGPGGGSTP